MDVSGAYAVDRAAALSGVPRSTVHRWARDKVVVPSVSSARVMLWSYADLMGLRVVYWLRKRKPGADGVSIPASSMNAVRRALDELRSLDLKLWNSERPPLLIDEGGKILVDTDAAVYQLDGQTVSADLLNLIEPFSTDEGSKGPDLISPRPDLRILPGKISGSPHVMNTRLETRAIAALSDSGFDALAIHRMYPFVAESHINQAIDLEAQLAENLRKRAA